MGLQRSIEIDLSKRDGDARTWPCTLSSETPVPRRDRAGAYDEVLSHDTKAVDLSRAPLPVIEGHDSSRVNVGLIDGLRLDDGKLRGILRLGASARAGELAADIDSGIVRNLSVGYSIDAAEESRSANSNDEEPPRRRIVATRWTPHECSIVAVPADISVGIGRSKKVAENTVEIVPAVSAERMRVAEITKLGARCKLPEMAAQLAGSGATLEAAREAMLNTLADRSDALGISGIGGADFEVGFLRRRARARGRVGFSPGPRGRRSRIRAGPREDRRAPP